MISVLYVVVVLLVSSKLLGFCQFFYCKSKASLFKCTVDELPTLFSFAQRTEMSAMEFCSIIAKKPHENNKAPVAPVAGEGCFPMSACSICNCRTAGGQQGSDCHPKSVSLQEHSVEQSVSALVRICCGHLLGADSAAGAAVLLLEGGRLQLLSPKSCRGGQEAPELWKMTW